MDHGKKEVTGQVKMIVKIQPLEQWTGNTDEEQAVYLEVPETLDVDSVMSGLYYGEKYNILVEELVKCGAKIIPCPIRIITI